MQRKLRKRLYVWAPIVLAAGIGGAAFMLLSPDGQGEAHADDLGRTIVARPVQGLAADAEFIDGMARFSIELFKKGYRDDANSLLSPLSATLALGMTAGGAGGNTRAQMEQVLGGLPLERLDRYLHTYAGALGGEDGGGTGDGGSGRDAGRSGGGEANGDGSDGAGGPDATGKAADGDDSEQMAIANSIWLRDDPERLAVSESFLQRNADYYGAAVYRAPFDTQTVKDMNGWVSKQTKGMIDSIIQELPDSALLYLVNAIAFDAAWKAPYGSAAVQDGKFAVADGERQPAKMMHSKESVLLKDGEAIGFMRPYAGDRFSFAAMLPPPGTPIGSYVNGLTGEAWLKLLNGAQTADIDAAIPKFTYSADYEMKPLLGSLGMTDAFDPGLADFGGIGSTGGGDGLYISEVLHKTFIAVDEQGTKAAAVTAVGVTASAMPKPVEPIVIELNRPFFYAIVDNATKLPIFLGTVVSLAE